MPCRPTARPTNRERSSSSANYVDQSADGFYLQGHPVFKDQTPPFLQIDQQTVWVDGVYGLSDAFAFDWRAGWSAANTKVKGPPDTDGIADFTAGFTWRLVDEDISESSGPGIALRAAAIFAGDYDVGQPNAIGDGGNGFEASVIVGKVLAGRFALASELGLRSRNNDIPRETYFNLTGYLLASPKLTLRGEYHLSRSSGDLDIGGPGFNAMRFPEVNEDVDRISFGGAYNFSDRMRVGLNGFSVIDGRNTSDFDAVAATFTYGFDAYIP